MAHIKTEKEYEAAMARIDELLPLTWQDGTPEDSPENIELNLLSELVAEYEDIQAQAQAGNAQVTFPGRMPQTACQHLFKV